MGTKTITAGLILGLWFFSGLWALSGCGIYTEVTVSSDSLADFSKYKTFAWLPDDYDTAHSPYNNEIIRNNLKNYFGQGLTERGFTVNLDSPDVLLQLVIVNKKREKEVYYPVHPRPYYYCNYYYCSRYYFPYPYEYYYHHFPLYCYTTGYCKEKIQYVEGSITLNVIDRLQNKLIWAGTAKGDIYDPSYINEDIHPAVKRILRDFPVKEMTKKTKQAGDDVFLMNNKPVTQK